MTTGIQYLRNLVRFYSAGQCTETWLARLSVNDLMKLYDVDRQSDFDRPPWRWTYAQVADALKNGDIPNWDDDGNPIPSVKKAETEV